MIHDYTAPLFEGGDEQVLNKAEKVQLLTKVAILMLAACIFFSLVQFYKLFTSGWNKSSNLRVEQWQSARR